MATRSELESAYRATAYGIFLPAGLAVVRLAEPCPSALATLRPWAILTAWNPGSAQLSASDNAQRQAALEVALLEAGFEPYAGENVADDGNWPVEESCLVHDISYEQAVALAGRFGQNAIIYCREGGEPQLLWVCESA